MAKTKKAVATSSEQGLAKTASQLAKAQRAEYERAARACEVAGDAEGAAAFRRILAKATGAQS